MGQATGLQEVVGAAHLGYHAAAVKVTWRTRRLNTALTSPSFFRPQAGGLAVPQWSTDSQPGTGP